MFKNFSTKAKLQVTIAFLLIYTFAVFLTIGSIKNAYTLESKDAYVDIPETVISTPVEGIVKQVNLKNGDKVSKGDIILVIDNIDIRDKLANIKGRAEIEDLSLLYSILRSSELGIKAPADGILYGLDVSEGQNLNEKQTIFKIVSLDKYTITGEFQTKLDQYLELSKYTNSVKVRFADKEVDAFLSNANDANYDSKKNIANLEFKLNQPLGRNMLNGEKVTIVMRKPLNYSIYFNDLFTNIKNSVKNVFTF